MVIALIVTPEGFPLAYEVMAGNTADTTTLDDFLARIEALYGKAERTWVMDRGIPSEASLARMRGCEPPIHYLVGTPKGRLSQLEQAFLDRPWEAVPAARPGASSRRSCGPSGPASAVAPPGSTGRPARPRSHASGPSAATSW